VGPRSFKAGRGELHRQLSATLAALGRNQAARNRQQAARARHDMRAWQVERRKRTRHLIELGGLVMKAGLVNLTGDDRATILGALLWMADKLQSDQGEQARQLWAAKGKQAFEADPATHKRTDRTVSAVRR
jgi:Conjugal transfer protein TraD